MYRLLTSASVVYHDSKLANDPNELLEDLCSILNRKDVFADFASGSSVWTRWAGSEEQGSIGIWNFLRQVILTKELAQRLDAREGNGSARISRSILASLIISDLWLKN